MKEKDPDRLSFSWVKRSHKNRNYHLPCHVYMTSSTNTSNTTGNTSIMGVHERSHPGVNSMTGECGSWARPPTPFPFLLPGLPSLTGSIKAFHAELLSLDLFGARAGAGGLSHCSCPIFVTQDWTEAWLALSHCHWGRVARSVKRGAGGCGDAAQGLQRDGFLVRSPSETRHDSRWPAGFWKPSSSARLHQKRESL